MKLSEQAKALRDALTPDIIQAIDDLPGRTQSERDALVAIQKQRLSEEEKLEEFRKRAIAEQTRLKQELENFRNDRAMELQNHSKVITAGEAVLTELKAKVAKARDEYNEIQSSVDALRRKLG